MKEETTTYNPCANLDDWRMEILCERYKKAPCGMCKNVIILDDLTDFRCDCFKGGIIPTEIVNGTNQHTEPIVGQLNSAVFSEYEFKI